MRIVGIEPTLVDVPLREPVHGVHGITTVQRSVLVRVTSDDGIEGWGNVDPSPGYSAMSAAEVHATVRRIGPALAGADPFNVRRALAVMDREAPGRYEAIAAVEMALIDLKARALGLPVHSLLGGRVKDEVAFNAWIGTVPPEQAAREATAWLARGFRSAKIKVSGAGPDGIERVAAVRAAVGARMALRVDFNESLTRVEAVPFIRRLEPYDLTLVEQLIPREAADLVKVKVMKEGGLLRTLAMVECAAAAGLRVVIGHGFGLTLSTLAEASVATVSEAIIDGCEAVGPL